MKKDKLINIGRILKPHGIKGELKAEILDEYKDSIQLLAEIIVAKSKDDPHNLFIAKIENMRFHKNHVLFMFEGLNNPEDAAGFRNWHLLVPESLTPPLEEDEFYVSDLMGAKVEIKDGDYIGDIVSILPGGHHDLYEVRNFKTGKVNMIPAMKNFIESIDLEQRKMIIKPIEGLIEL
ncbi:MAG: ribosome maturation factor RimM [Vulcanimicrobiota bacterium]